MKFFLAGDKYGFKTIKYVKEYLDAKKFEYVDLGVKNENEEMRLEIMIPLVVKGVLEDSENKGILSCGTGIGVEVGVNKFSGIRASLATNEQIAEWASVYDKCNVLCLVGWQSERDHLFKMLDKWLNAKYDGDQSRLKSFEEFDRWH